MRFEEVIKNTETIGNIFTISEITMKVFDEISVRSYLEDDDYVVYCDKSFLKGIKKLLKPTNIYLNANMYDIWYKTTFTFKPKKDIHMMYGCNKFHFMKRKDIKGAVVLPYVELSELDYTKCFRINFIDNEI